MMAILYYCTTIILGFYIIVEKKTPEVKCQTYTYPHLLLSKKKGMRPLCDCKFCPTRNCPVKKPEDLVPISMPKRRLKPRPKLADDDVCKKHQPKYQCGPPTRSLKLKPKTKKPSLLEMIADRDCACNVIARSVGAGGVHHHIGLRELRETINKNAQKLTIDEESIEEAPEES